MLKRHVGRLRDHFGVSSARVFGKGPACASENFVARSELRYLAANRFHLAGQVHAESWILDRKSTRLNSSHGYISYAVFCLKKKKLLNLQVQRCSCTTFNHNN